ncbi:hypothetical protein V6N13_136386 [Hibiscus sabdariffa]|uniref:F-box associated domain-containing protein n=1 Tax=Hibiscus sabdariffa TaxID=183260 RepID=A0ABR2DNR6_9ROSI
MASYDLNTDVTFEILSRTDLKTMKKCRVLSRECNTLTYESDFMQCHIKRTNILCGYLIQSLSFSHLYFTFLSDDEPGINDRKLKFDFLHADHVEILAVTETGLVFCKSQHPENQHYFCKPTTQQRELMPSPNPPYPATQYPPEKIAMIVLQSIDLWFKIVWLSDNSESYDHTYKFLQCKIFDSNTWAWKQSDDLKLSYDEVFESTDAISIHGGLHWLTLTGKKYRILTFHQDKENWESIHVPDSCTSDYCYRIHLTIYEGKLTIISKRRGADLLEVWTMEYYKQKCWNKRYNIDLEGRKEEIGYYMTVSFYNAETILMLNDCRAIFYNFKKKQIIRSIKLGTKHKYPMLVSFVQTDYEPIQLKRN